ncbi:MAG: helix-turn-helix transcriptional regulator [Gemmatimonadales bacterium]|nr:helix-turn-helix transcriptional regulator [Gemmatimonadales bacterium]
MPTIFRLADILAAHEISQSELARRSGVALRTISRLCRNETASVALETLDSLATALGVEPGELIARERPTRRKG